MRGQGETVRLWLDRCTDEEIESDPELYMCDNEAKKPRKRRFTGNHDLSSPEDMLENSPWDQLFDSDSDRSLEDPEEFDRKLKAHKKKDVKLNKQMILGMVRDDPATAIALKKCGLEVGRELIFFINESEA